MSNLLTILLLLSGISSLTYQVVWVRLLGLSIGVTSAAVGAVLAAVFLGMAVGAWLSGSALRSKYSGLTVFAFVELTVAFSALLILPVILNLDHFLTLFPSLGSELWFRFMVVTLLLSIPTAGLGAAYPLISNVVIKSQKEIGSGLSLLYFAYTLGAVAGSLISAFVLIPRWGLDGALYSAVAVNILVAITAGIINRVSSPLRSTSNSEHQVALSHKPGATGSWRGGVILTITGFSAIAIETGWIKYLSIYTGSTFYGFSILMAIFLGGIALGSLIAKNLIEKLSDLNRALIFGLLLLGVTLYLNRTALGYLPDIENYINTQQFHDSIKSMAKYAALIALIAPVTILLGILFPLSMKYYCGDYHSLGSRVGVGYALNTIAGLVGAAVAGLWLIPTYGTDALLIIVASALVIMTIPLSHRLLQKRGRLSVMASALIIVLVGISLPGLNFQKMIICMECNTSLIEEGRGPEVLFAKEGHTGVISLVKNDNGIIELKNNSLNEAMLPLSRARGEILLGLLPSVFVPNAKSSLLIGYGAGTTASVLAATPVGSIKVVELEPVVVEAMQILYGGNIPHLNDPRLTLVHNDARNVLQLDTHQYDTIISQPSHPWRNGAAQLFSREFFQTVKSRLAKNGVFTQWVNLFQMDVSTLRSLIASFYDIFPKGVVFIHRSPEQIFLLGSNEPLVLDRGSVDTVFQRPAMNQILREANMHNADRLLHYFLFTRKEAVEMAEDAELVTDLNIIPEVRLGKPGFETNPIEIYNLLQKYTVSLMGEDSSN